MKIILILGWLLLLGFVVWEFIVANQLPDKYSKLNPSTIRMVDVTIAILALLSLWYIATK